MSDTPNTVTSPIKVWTTSGDYERGALLPGTEEVTEDTIAYTPFPEDARIGSVTVGLGRTINTGNYNSVRVDVRVTLPALVEQIEDGSAGEHAAAIANRYATDLTSGLDF